MMVNTLDPTGVISHHFYNSSRDYFDFELRSTDHNQTFRHGINDVINVLIWSYIVEAYLLYYDVTDAGVGVR